jgi:hypothetical protein
LAPSRMAEQPWGGRRSRTLSSRHPSPVSSPSTLPTCHRISPACPIIKASVHPLVHCDLDCHCTTSPLHRLPHPSPAPPCRRSTLAPPHCHCPRPPSVAIVPVDPFAGRHCLTLRSIRSLPSETRPPLPVFPNYRVSPHIARFEEDSRLTPCTFVSAPHDSPFEQYHLPDPRAPASNELDVFSHLAKRILSNRCSPHTAHPTCHNNNNRMASLSCEGT